MEPAVASALVSELAKKTSVCWLRYSVDGEEPTEHPAWHVWSGDALLLVSGGEEQQLPYLEYTDRVEVTMRSADNGGRLVTWVGVPRRILPADEEWAPTVAALATARLNIASLVETPRRWETESVVTRVEPTGELVAEPGRLPADDLAAPPARTPATTRGRLPRVLHRRKRRRPPLSGG